MMFIIYLPLIVLATATVYAGSKLSNNNDKSEDNAQSTSFASAEIDLSWTEAIIIPISASLSLLLLFFFFHYLQYFLLLTVLIGSTTSLFQICLYGGKYLQVAFTKFYGLSNETNGIWFVSTFSIIITVVVACEWIRSGNFICHDILGCSLCIAFISTLRFPSLKLATFCLAGLVIYDIYWVFLSEYFFRSNVMVEVATKKATNPVHDLGAALNIPMLQEAVTRTIELPIKLLIPVSGARMMMLGLGDIALPGALVSLALRCDLSLSQRRRADLATSSSSLLSSRLPLGKHPGMLLLSERELEAQGPPAIPRDGATLLLEHCIVAYALSLSAAILASQISGHAQPALIYLVPGLLITFAARAYYCGVLHDVWAGPTKIEQDS